MAALPEDRDDFFDSDDYENYVVDDVSFPTGGTAPQILAYLLAKGHIPRMVEGAESPRDTQSSLYHFAQTFVWVRTWDDDKILWDYPETKWFLDIITNAVEESDDEEIPGITSTGTDEWLGQLETNVNVLLTLLKVDLSRQPFNEDLRVNVPRLYVDDVDGIFNEDLRVNVPRLDVGDPDRIFLFFPDSNSDDAEWASTRKQTVLFLIDNMGYVYTERGNTKGYKKWMEHCRIYLQSVLSTPL